MKPAGWIATVAAATTLGVGIATLGAGAAWADPEVKSSAKASGGATAPSTGPAAAGTEGTQAKAGTDPLGADQTEKFQAYVKGEHRDAAVARAKPKVGEVLPEDMRFYEIGPQWNMTKYMYTLIGGDTVLVERGTRKVVQIVNVSRDTTKAGTTTTH